LAFKEEALNILKISYDLEKKFKRINENLKYAFIGALFYVLERC